MLITSIILFALAAVSGVTILIPLLTGKPIVKPVAVVHGIFAATALIILIIFSINYGDDFPILSLILFVVAAIGGIILFVRDLNNKPGPKALALIHAAAAVIAFLILLVFALSL
ncbi:MAG: hypothetical protein IPM14_04865 [bacterium]|nr:hypothetical protein [bacterium]